MISLFNHQKKALEHLRGYNKCAVYYDMGLGKTYIGSEKMKELNGKVNLVICQKSKVQDWVNHFTEYYEDDFKMIYDCTQWDKNDWLAFSKNSTEPCVMVINYDLVWRRPALLKAHYDTVMLDESSLISNETTKRTKSILKLHFDNIILLSGSVCGGKYEKLYSQMKLLGWKVTKTEWWDRYIQWHLQDYGMGVPFKQIDGYKNTNEMIQKMHDYGCIFKKTEEVIDLPTQNDIDVRIKPSVQYRQFKRDKIIEIDDKELVGDTSLTELLYLRQLAGAYSKEKLKAFEDLLESTDDRLVVFYNFNAELDELIKIACKLKRPVSRISGQIKDLSAYENDNDSITFVQYQAGAMGLNLQKANKMIYFSPTLSSDLYEQSRKRIHRIGQNKPCFYYKLTCGIESKIYRVLAQRRDFTEELFKELKDGPREEF